MNNYIIKDYYTVKEVSRITGYTERSVRDWIVKGLLKAVKKNPEIHSSYYNIKREDLEQLINSNKIRLKTGNAIVIEGNTSTDGIAIISEKLDNIIKEAEDIRKLLNT